MTRSTSAATKSKSFFLSFSAFRRSTSLQWLIRRLLPYSIGIEESVRGDLKWLAETPLVREDLKKGTQGFVFDIVTGKVEKITVS